MPFAEVDEVLKRELGSNWRDYFSEFEEVECCFGRKISILINNQAPLAAASLAQVHSGRLRDGRRVAIKVQFPAVSRQLKMDLATISLCVRIIGRVFPKFQFTWVLPEFKQYMRQEIDFRIEAMNNARIKKMFADNAQFATPDVYNEYCTDKVLVMEWIDGCKVPNFFCFFFDLNNYKDE